MIRHFLELTSLRFYEKQSDDPFEPYDAVCTILWESQTVIWVRGLNGPMSRKLLREFLHWLVKNNITKIKAHRHENRSLPAGRRVGDHIEILVSDLLIKARQSSSNQDSSNASKSES